MDMAHSGSCGVRVWCVCVCFRVKYKISCTLLGWLLTWPYWLEWQLSSPNSCSEMDPTSHT